MEQKTMIWAIVGVIAIACIGGGAWFMTQDGSDPDTGDSVVTDMRGRTVEVPNDVDQVVCIAAGAVRMVAYMDASDMIVGVDDMDKGLKGPPPASPRWNMATYRLTVDTSGLPCIGDISNIKAIMETGADLIITTKTDIDELDTLQDTSGIPVVAVLADGNINVDDKEFRDNITLLGKVLGKEDRAEQLLSGIDSMIGELSSYASKVTNKPKAYVGGMFFWMKGGIYKTTGNYLPFELAGVRNVMSFEQGNPYDTNLKTLAASEAEFMFFDSVTNKDCKQTFSEEKDTLSVLKAVSDGNIYSTYSYKFYGTNWESELMNAYFIGSVVNPDVYTYDWKEKVTGVLELFYPGSGLTADDVNERQGPGATELDW